MSKKITIEIKNRWTGSILFKYCTTDNTISKTLVRAVEKGADLRGADLQGADLQGADLRGADLRRADLQGADLRGAYLRRADLQGADLQGAYLQGADLQGVKIKTLAVFTGLYKYIVIPFISEDGTQYVKMGCYTRTVKEWDKDFWNNESEFPNNKNVESQLRMMAYKYAKQWLKLNR